MRKSTLFVSGVLTTFVLAVLFGVASAYKNIVSATEVAAATQPTAMVEMVNQPIEAVVPTQVVPTQVVTIVPEAAAAIASKVLGRTDLYSVEITLFENTDAYLVTFSSGDIVYLSLDGQILSISKLPVTIITQRRPGSDNEDTGGGTTAVVTTSSGDDDHEDHEEHEEHEDGDDD